MKIGIVGYQACGKSSLFEWLTETPADPSASHRTQSAMATVPDVRIAGLCEVYHPKKVTQASLELVDTPGLSRDHEGSAAKLAMIREAGCLVIVIAAYGNSDFKADLSNFEDDLLIADLDIVQGRVERLRESVKKPRPNRDEQLKELAALEPLLEGLEAGKAVRQLELTPEQQRATRSFQLLSEKPRFVVLNIEEDETQPQRLLEQCPESIHAVAVPLRLQLELQAMQPDERREFCAEMGVAQFDRDSLIRTIMDISGQMLFFTAGEKEVRSWMIRQGGTALEAADGIHSDLARGFIRAETISAADLIRLGSEREVKAQNLVRKEPKDYVIQDGDVITIQHN